MERGEYIVENKQWRELGEDKPLRTVVFIWGDDCEAVEWFGMDKSCTLKELLHDWRICQKLDLSIPL